MHDATPLARIALPDDDLIEKIDKELSNGTAPELQDQNCKHRNTLLLKYRFLCLQKYRNMFVQKYRFTLSQKLNQA